MTKVVALLLSIQQSATVLVFTLGLLCTAALQVLALDASNVEAIACLAADHFYSDQPELALRYYRRLLQVGRCTACQGNEMLLPYLCGCQCSWNRIASSQCWWCFLQSLLSLHPAVACPLDNRCLSCR